MTGLFWKKNSKTPQPKWEYTYSIKPSIFQSSFFENTHLSVPWQGSYNLEEWSRNTQVTQKIVARKTPKFSRNCHTSPADSWQLNTRISCSLLHKVKGYQTSWPQDQVLTSCWLEQLNPLQHELVTVPTSTGYRGMQQLLRNPVLYPWLSYITRTRNTTNERR